MVKDNDGITIARVNNNTEITGFGCDSDRAFYLGFRITNYDQHSDLKIRLNSSSEAHIISNVLIGDLHVFPH